MADMETFLIAVLVLYLAIIGILKVTARFEKRLDTPHRKAAPDDESTS